jgi:hypothetical protein
MVSPENNMTRTIHCLALLITVGLVSTDVAEAQLFPQTEYLDRGPSTLMKWSAGGEENETEVAAPRIITDRPHFAEAATTVGLGRVQIETGYTYYLDKNNGTSVVTHSFPETLFRIGMFREWFEFRFGYNYFGEITDSAAGKTKAWGSDDIYLGAKVALTKQSGILPELTVFPQMRVPSGSSQFTSGEVLPGMNFVYAWLLTEKLELEANTNVNRRLDPSFDHHYTEFFQTVNFEYDLCETLLLFNEFVLIWPEGALTAQTQYYEHAGMHIFLRPNLQIDLHAGVGLNQAADNFFGGSGLSWRW